MPFLILLLFIALPIIEIAVLIKVADVIDLWPTILLIILTAVIGVYLLRLQGLGSLARAQTALNEGRLPLHSISDAVGLLLAGAFLLTPGLLTDSLGFLLLVPAFRHGLAKIIYNRMLHAQNIKVDIFAEGSRAGGPFDPFGPAPGDKPPGQRPAGKGPVIEGEIIEPEDPPDKGQTRSNGKGQAGPKSKKPSPWGR